jgi:molecular chaperone GrpE
MEHNREDQSVAPDQGQDESTAQTTADDSGNGEFDWQEKYKRLAADFSNYRRRVSRERTQLANRLEDDLLKDLLSLYDDFSRIGLQRQEDAGALLEGVQAVQRKWQQWLDEQHVAVNHPVGEPFDHDFHEAALQEPVNDPDMDSKVIRVIENGYLRNGRILRHAKVAVARFHGDERRKSVPKGKEEE